MSKGQGLPPRSLKTVLRSLKVGKLATLKQHPFPGFTPYHFFNALSLQSRVSYDEASAFQGRVNKDVRPVFSFDSSFENQFALGTMALMPKNEDRQQVSCSERRAILCKEFSSYTRRHNPQINGEFAALLVKRKSTASSYLTNLHLIYRFTHIFSVLLYVIQRGTKQNGF